MLESKIDATLYLSDQHFGEESPERRVMGERLGDFLEKYNININKVIDCGDGIKSNLLQKALGKTEEEITKINTNEAKEIRNFYKKILPHGGEVDILLGNHQTEIVDGEVTNESSKNARESSISNLEQYLKKEVFTKELGVNFNVIRGIQETEKNTLVEHGTYYDVFSKIKEILNEFSDDMALQEKLEKLNNNPQIEILLQKFWQNFRNKSWPIFRKLGEENYQALAKIFHFVKDLESGFMRLKKTDIPFSNSHNEHVLKQIELMKKLANDSNSLTMVSGHRHRKNTQSKDNLLSISLGDWEIGGQTPSCAIHTPTANKDRWIIAEYCRDDDYFDLNQGKGEGHWIILKQFEYDETQHKWEEKNVTDLKTIGENTIGDEWMKYEIEGMEKTEGIPGQGLRRNIRD